jgi:uncharacterized protein YqeY
MSLKLTISEDLKTAMKEKNTAKLSILRVLKSEIERNEQSASGRTDLSEGDIIKLVKKLIEGIKETTNNETEIIALEAYLPKQLLEDEIRALISLLSFKDLGQTMKYFKEHYDGRYDGKVLSLIVKENLA